MTPYEFLIEEFKNVDQALKETLRYDYGPEQSGNKYYEECKLRLTEIDKKVSSISAEDFITISTLLKELSYLTIFISLIERSHLGEFSWPFAEELRRISTKLLAEKDLKGKIYPIIHIVADGQGYRIINEPQVPPISGKQRLVIIAFPRPLKHHVLLHTLFGHELGHTALYTTEASRVLNRDVVAALIATGPMKNETAINTWLNDAAAPQGIKDTLKNYEEKNGCPYIFTCNGHQAWLKELVCDLFGLLLFGPGFLAAHRTCLLPKYPNAYNIGQTHPSYAVRNKMLIRAMRLLEWHETIADASHEEFYQAEGELLKSILDDQYDDWADLFDDTQLNDAIAGVRKIFEKSGAQGHEPINADRLVHLVGRLKNGLPPIIAKIEPDGTPKLEKVEISQMLYAGWVYWAGREHLKTAEGESLDFFKTNRLCDHALLQQNAINLALGKGSA